MKDFIPCSVVGTLMDFTKSIGVRFSIGYSISLNTCMVSAVQTIELSNIKESNCQNSNKTKVETVSVWHREEH